MSLLTKNNENTVINLAQKSRITVGHDDVKKNLSQSLKSGKIFPTWIFCGSFGIGKSTLAHQFAKSILSEYVPEQTENKQNFLDIPDNHIIHKLIETRIHPDFFILEQKNESVSIDETRKLLSKIYLTPMSKWRVVIIENAANLNKNTYNSLLKILEEPPANTVFILICNHTSFIPKTLLSRTSRLNMNPIANALVIQLLEKQGFKNTKKLAEISNGSVGFANIIAEKNGIEIYNNILSAFHSNGKNYKIFLKNVIENNLCNDFFMLKELLLNIIQKYISFICKFDETFSEIEINTFNSIKTENINYKIKKILKIIERLNKCEFAMLDKNAIIIEVFENFFNEE